MQKIGILGGGQLGRMIIQAAINYPYDVYILDPDPNAPCSQLTSHFQVGELTHFDTVYHFGKKVDILTIEIEHVNADALERLEAEGIQVYPQSQVVRIIQDKRVQKQFYQTEQIPTADFVLINKKSELQNHVDFLPAFLKLGKAGYDGKGVLKLTRSSDFEQAFAAPSLLEKAVTIDKEISVIVARNLNGEISAFPVVELVFDPVLNLVDYLLCPAQITNDQAQEATTLAKQIIEKLGMVGLLAVEMFLTKEGKILVNEIAPRPHNSGHQSIEGNETSQFEQHLRAINNLPLGSTEVRMPSAMVNLLGAPAHTGEAHYEGLDEVLRMPQVYVHLYGKKITKPGRKMGHVTIIENNIDRLLEKVEQVKNRLQVVTRK
ncbi:MAG: 5-(carboxyamino)imidazole ribonucleotide synthase [Bacteroidota bacterium]